MQEAPLMLKNKTARRIKDIPGFVFPGGVKVIINFTVDFDAMIFRKFLREPKLWCAQGEFGGRTGLWRLLDVFGEFDVRTTLFLPGQTGLLYPEVLRRADDDHLPPPVAGVFHDLMDVRHLHAGGVGHRAEMEAAE